MRRRHALQQRCQRHCPVLAHLGVGVSDAGDEFRQKGRHVRHKLPPVDHQPAHVPHHHGRSPLEFKPALLEAAREDGDHDGEAWTVDGVDECHVHQLLDARRRLVAWRDDGVNERRHHGLHFRALDQLHPQRRERLLCCGLHLGLGVCERVDNRGDEHMHDPRNLLGCHLHLPCDGIETRHLGLPVDVRGLELICNQRKSGTQTVRADGSNDGNERLLCSCANFRSLVSDFRDDDLQHAEGVGLENVVEHHGQALVRCTCALPKLWVLLVPSCLFQSIEHAIFHERA
mmetsp:Transcript_39696/g.81299  ORF Transcript_39696/g.81299 Transcript_39696/m.81299 type:complete len:287 (-) Transcript_39696:630-1490(-)